MIECDNGDDTDCHFQLLNKNHRHLCFIELYIADTDFISRFYHYGCYNSPPPPPRETVFVLGWWEDVHEQVSMAIEHLGLQWNLSIKDLRNKGTSLITILTIIHRNMYKPQWQTQDFFKGVSIKLLRAKI